MFRILTISFSELEAISYEELVKILEEKLSRIQEEAREIKRNSSLNK